MKKADILEIVNCLNFNKNDFWVVAGSAMCLYGLRQETNDVDLGCTSHLADELEAAGYVPVIHKGGSRTFTYNDDVEIFENFLFDKVELFEGIPVISLTGLLEMKRYIGREKDRQDMKIIEQYLCISHD